MYPTCLLISAASMFEPLMQTRRKAENVSPVRFVRGGREEKKWDAGDSMPPGDDLVTFGPPVTYNVRVSAESFLQDALVVVVDLTVRFASHRRR